ncbi:hypothetical protein P7K49_008730 [Saguinus oedipus]|uniref:Ras-related protein Rab n=1 Tax=Saguinus oedipus TaxID=9490 RepID=A0ABQ9VYK0_SAGOE|nr:hypothetical protein P7K49_008730 [Saguinus oedipus]
MKAMGPKARPAVGQEVDFQASPDPRPRPWRPQRLLRPPAGSPRPTRGRPDLRLRRARREAPPERRSASQPGQAWGRRGRRERPSAGSSPGRRQALPRQPQPGRDRRWVPGPVTGRAGLGGGARGRAGASPGAQARPTAAALMAGGGTGDAGLGAAAAGAPEIHEHLFKVLVIGELGVGKTSIIKRYVHQLFSQHYRATIGVDFALKVLNWDSRTLVRLQLWDIAGRDAVDAAGWTRRGPEDRMGIFDDEKKSLYESSTFEAVLKWKRDLDSKVHLPNGSPIPAVLLANKCDQNRDTSQSPSQMDQFCKEHGFTGWFETSAKIENLIDASDDLQDKSKAMRETPQKKDCSKTGQWRTFSS